jgi:hypothetical protein
MTKAVLSSGEKPALRGAKKDGQPSLIFVVFTEKRGPATDNLLWEISLN